MKRISCIITALFLFIFASGCLNNPLGEAEELIEGYDFKGALEVLDRMGEKGRDDERFHRLRALALFVEGEMENGFNEISTSDSLEDDKREADAEILIKAATVLIREKKRIGDVIELLDSCLSYDINMKDQVDDLLWKRGLEYMNVPGDCGYQLFRYASEIDVKIMRRLRAHNRIFYSRYVEIDKMLIHLEQFDARVKRFKGDRGHYPHSFRELVSSGLTSGMVVTYKTWKVDVVSRGDDGYMLTATALKNNPTGIPVGTVLKYP